MCLVEKNLIVISSNNNSSRSKNNKEKRLTNVGTQLKRASTKTILNNTPNVSQLDDIYLLVHSWKTGNRSISIKRDRAEPRRHGPGRIAGVVDEASASERHHLPFRPLADVASTEETESAGGKERKSKDERYRFLE